MIPPRLIFRPYLDVISNVVPKICARMNSAILSMLASEEDRCCQIQRCWDVLRFLSLVMAPVGEGLVTLMADRRKRDRLPISRRELDGRYLWRCRGSTKYCIASGVCEPASTPPFPLENRIDREDVGLRSAPLR